MRKALVSMYVLQYFLVLTFVPINISSTVHGLSLTLLVPAVDSTILDTAETTVEMHLEVTASIELS